MATTRFSKGEALGFVWNAMKSRLGFFIVLLILYTLIPVIAGIVPQLLAHILAESAAGLLPEK